MGIIRLNGKSSKGIFHVENAPDYEMAERSYEVTPIPGRNGDHIVDNGNYLNVERSYTINFGDEGADYASLASKISNFLNTSLGYVRLEDSYTPDQYVMARYKGGVSMQQIMQQAVTGVITFDRKPERFLKKGEIPMRVSNGSFIINNTPNPSKPIIKVSGTAAGTVKIGSYEIKINAISEYVTLDCENESAYKGGLNCNRDVEAVGRRFPTLVPGRNNVSFTGGITAVDITPRWWIL